MRAPRRPPTAPMVLHDQDSLAEMAASIQQSPASSQALVDTQTLADQAMLMLRERLASSWASDAKTDDTAEHSEAPSRKWPCNA